MKRVLVFLIIFIVLVCVVTVGLLFYDRLDKTFCLDEYGFSMKYPYDYAKAPMDGGFRFINSKNGITIKIVAVDVEEKSSFSIDEVIERYFTTAQLLNHFNCVMEKTDSEVFTIDNNLVGRVEIVAVDDEETFKGISILMPLPKREITVVFEGLAENMEKNLDEINEIIESIEIFDV